MNARMGSSLKGLPGALDVFATTARQGGDGRSPNFARYSLHRLEVAFRGDGKSCLDHIHAQTIELARHAQLLVLIHAVAWSLFPIAQRGVEYLDSLWFQQFNPSGPIRATFALKQKGHHLLVDDGPSRNLILPTSSAGSSGCKHQAKNGH